MCFGSEHWEKSFYTEEFLVGRVYCGCMGSKKVWQWHMPLVIFSPSPRLGIWGVSEG